MNTYSHIRIGKMVLKRLESEYQISLPKTVFIWANCRPDYSVKYHKIPHNKEPMKDTFERLAYEVSHCKWERDNILFIADRLGVICHFLCDFFCYAHSPSFSGSLKEHIAYESKVNHFLKENSELCNRWTNSLLLDRETDVSKSLSWLEERYQSYLQEKMQIVSDVQFSLEVCVELTANLLSTILLKSSVPICGRVYNII